MEMRRRRIHLVYTRYKVEEEESIHLFIRCKMKRKMRRKKRAGNEEEKEEKRRMRRKTRRRGGRLK